MKHITQLKHDEIFVFGSNLAGRHGKGAALTARFRFGAKLGTGSGPTGRCYAIPTKDAKLNVLPLDEIERHVNRFIEYAIFNQQYQFLVTKIGCGLAGYEPEQIAPMFKQARSLTNVHLPEEFQ